MLVWVENSSLLPHWLRVGDGGGEEAVPLHSAVQTRPLVVSAAENVGIKIYNCNAQVITRIKIF